MSNAKTGSDKSNAIRLGKSAVGPVYEQIKQAIRSNISSGKWPPGHRLPTLRELSTQLDVAYATVERAVRDLTRDGMLEGRKRGGTRVASPKRKHVGAVGILGYTEYGKLLTQSRYYSTVLLLLQEKIIDRDEMAVYDCISDSKPFDAAFNNLTHVDGLIAFDPYSKWTPQLRACLANGLPVITVGETLNTDIPAVASASLTDTQAAISHAIALGHRHIACAMHPFMADNPSATLRIQGFQRAMTASPAGFQPSQIVLGDIPAQAAALLALHPAPTAIFLPQSRHFPELFEALRGTRLQPGKHTFICAYDENLYCTIQPHGFEFLSVEQRMDNITSRTVDALLQMINQPGYNPGLIQIPANIFHVDRNYNKTRLSP
jgi:DNA-binding LacI/PurR family transcriptional regulator